MKRIIQLLIVAGVCFLNTAFAKPLTLNEITEGVCRITVSNQSSNSYFGRTQTKKGSGTVVGQSPTSYYILTNAHVVGNARTVQLEFFRGGLKTPPLPANVIWKQKIDGRDVDFAICEISKSYFGSYPPRIIPLAPPSYNLKPGYYISCVGCDNGRWARGWEGIIRQDERTRVIFTPAPIGGQSGSGIMVLIPDSNGVLHTRVGAILTWRIGHATDDEKASGAAIPISRLYQSMAGEVSHNTIPKNWIEVVHAGSKALGSDGRIYTTRALSDGSYGCVLNPGVHIVDWNYSKDCSCPSCRGKAWTPFSRLAPQPQQPKPSPSNPYGSIPPDIGAPWPKPPQIVDPVDPIVPIIPPAVIIDDKVADLAKEYEELLIEKEDLENSLLMAEKQARDNLERDNLAKKHKEVSNKSTTFFGNLSNLFGLVRNKLSGFGGGVMLGLGLWMLRIFWVKTIRKRLIVKVDSLQDYIQIQIEQRFGKEAGEESREMMEGVEDELMAVIDNVLANNKQKAKTEVSKIKLPDRITNGEGAMLRATKAEMLEAIRVAAAEVDEKDSPTTAKDIPERVKQILKAARK